MYDTKCDQAWWRMLAIPWKERKNCLRQVLDKNMRPYLKNKLSKKIWECDSNGRALA
jgi:hypothetical protein